MNIVQLQEQLKNFSQDQLVKEMQMPTGNAPQYLVLSEIMRRQRMQQDFAAQQAKGEPQTTVAQEAIAAAGVPQGGLASMAQALAPQTDMAQSTGVSQAPVQPMASGGPVRKMAEGDRVVRGGMVLIEQEDGSYRDEQGRVIRSPREDLVAGLGAVRSIPSRLGTAAREFSGSFADQMNADLARTGEEAMIRNMPPGAGRSGISTGRTMMPPTVMYRDTLDLGTDQGEIQTYLDALNSSQMQAEPPASMATPRSTFPARPEFVGSLPAASEYERNRRAAMEAAQPSVPPPDAGQLPADLGFLEGVGNLASTAWDRITSAAPMVRMREPEGGRADRDQQGGAPITPEDNKKLTDDRLAADKAAKEAAAAGIAAAAAPPSGAGGAGGGGAGGIAGAAGVSDYEQELLNVLARREKAAEQDKWLALAQVGLNMMASTNPTLLGAIGESGLKGVEAARTARDQYDKDKLDILGAIEQYRMSRAQLAARGSGGGRGRGRALPIGAVEIFDSRIEAIQDRLGDKINPVTPDEELKLKDDLEVLLLERQRLESAYLSQYPQLYGMPAGASPAEGSDVEFEDVPS